MDLRHDILAVHEDRCTSRRTQGHMQYRPLLGHVDLFPAKHVVDARTQTRPPCQLDEEPYRLVGNAVLGIIEVNTDGLDSHPFPAPGVVCEKFPQMQPPNAFVVLFENFQDRAAGRIPHLSTHLNLP